MSTLRPAWNSDNWDDAKWYVEMMTDETELARAAKEARYTKVRIAAIEKLTDQVVLADIVKTDASKEICVAAAKRLYCKKRKIHRSSFIGCK